MILAGIAGIRSPWMAHLGGGLNAYERLTKQGADLRVTLFWIFAAFLAFMAIIWSVHALDDYAAARFGYAPFAMPNVLFMLIPNGLLLVTIQNGGEQSQVLVTLAGAAMLGMLLLIRAKTNGWVALVAAPMLLFGAPVLVFSVLFRSLARADGGEE